MQVTQTNSSKNKKDDVEHRYITRCIVRFEENLEQILKMLSVGHTRSACARHVGMKQSEFFGVLSEGRKKIGDEDGTEEEKVQRRAHDIYIQVLKSGSMAQVHLEAMIIEDAKVNIKTAQWLLARRFRLKERHEPDIDILRQQDATKLQTDIIKMEMLQEKLRILKSQSGEGMTSTLWREILNTTNEAKAIAEGVELDSVH